MVRQRKAVAVGGGGWCRNWWWPGDGESDPLLAEAEVRVPERGWSRTMRSEFRIKGEGDVQWDLCQHSGRPPTCVSAIIGQRSLVH